MSSRPIQPITADRWAWIAVPRHRSPFDGPTTDLAAKAKHMARAELGVDDPNR